MASDKRLGKAVRQFALVSLGIGLEATVALEVIFTIANIQTLGVPIRYASIPSTVSAGIGIVFIPTLGFIMGKKAKSKRGKAIILICTSSLMILGNFMIFLANTIKLVYYDGDITESNRSIILKTSLRNHSEVEGWFTVAKSSPLDLSLDTPTIAAVPGTLDLFTNYSSSIPSSDLSKVSNIGTTSPIAAEEPVYFYAVFAMIGYCLIDCGYDSTNCFLKTFVLASTDPEGHASIIVKSILVSSIGGCFTAILGSIGIGKTLTAGTNHDSNAAQSALMAAICLILVISGLTTTLCTGFCCPPYTETSKTLQFNVDEKSSLILTESESPDQTSSLLLSNSNQGHDLRNHQSQSVSRDLTSALLLSNSSHRDILDNSRPERERIHPVSPSNSHTSNLLNQIDSIPNKGINGFFIKQKRQILINISTFFMFGALYSFVVYMVNFVGEGIFPGDPQAPASSEEYQFYLKGIEIGSLAALIYYISFTVLNLFQEILLQKVGWKIEIFVASGVYVVVNLVSALTATLWSFYITAVWTGIFRAVVVTVPYILANEFAKKQNKGGDASVAIAIVAAMLPCTFAICSALMGPLIDATGNVATPIYYTATCAFLSIVTIIFLKDD